MKSKIAQEILDDFRSRPGHEYRLHGTYLMMQWNLRLGDETSAMLSGAMEGEYDELRDGYRLFYNEIEDYRDIKICA